MRNFESDQTCCSLFILSVATVPPVRREMMLQGLPPAAHTPLELGHPIDDGPGVDTLLAKIFPTTVIGIFFGANNFPCKDLFG